MSINLCQCIPFQSNKIQDVQLMHHCHDSGLVVNEWNLNLTWLTFVRNTSFVKPLLSADCCGPPFSNNRLLVLPPLTLTLLHLCRGISVIFSLRSPSFNEPPLTLRVPRTAVVGATGASSCPKRCSDIARGDFMHVIVVGASVFAEETDFTSRSLPSFVQDVSFLLRERVFGAEVGLWDELGRSSG